MWEICKGWNLPAVESRKPRRINNRRRFRQYLAAYLRPPEKKSVSWQSFHLSKTAGDCYSSRFAMAGKVSRCALPAGVHVMRIGSASPSQGIHACVSIARKNQINITQLLSEFLPCPA
ncbi:hypothetical protein CA85_26300 [Allorhodopirellula solitaria]|uniref:Uncharacterized protein n=1 Tax=Allorhodopirellula solitaria TaxID=2527987 RepID=A0A5C5XVW1_9BACT|nr:hypothetical protein CA85_26300 [Allorhodopirellula solitaria]